MELTRKNAELTQQLKRQELVLKNFEREKDLQQRLIEQLSTQVEELKGKLKHSQIEKETLQKDL